MPIFCFKTLLNGETYGRGFFEYPDSLGKGPGTSVTGVTRFQYSAPDVGVLTEANNIHFVIGVNEYVSQFNIITSSPDRLRSLTAGPSQPHLLGPVATNTALKLTWPVEVSTSDECMAEAPAPAPEPAPAPAPEPEPEPAPVLPELPPAKVEITHIEYHGQVKRSQADEYVVITNNGGQRASLDGWKLYADDRGQDYIFPAGTYLDPGHSLRVYTNQIHPESGGHSYGIGSAIWNDKGDVGLLSDDSGNVVSKYGYGDKV